MCLVDMLQGAMTQSVSKSVVFSFRDVAMRLVEQFERSMISARVSKVRIDRRMIIQILAIIDRGMLDFANGPVDLGDGVFFLSVHPVVRRHALQMRARVAQIGQRMQVCRMSSGIVGECQRGTECNEECDYSAMAYDFHGLLK